MGIHQASKFLDEVIFAKWIAAYLPKGLIFLSVLLPKKMSRQPTPSMKNR